MRILVTGGAGYVGSVVVQQMLGGGFDVVCLDRFFFGIEALERLAAGGRLTLLRDDIRWFNPPILSGVDVVIDLAALSNDPAGELDPAKTFDINYLGRVRVAKLSKRYGVKRYILASSASNYGKQEGIVNEESKVNPITTYSVANNMAEIDTLPLNDDKFTVTVLRFSSIYGSSARMRFDLAVNSMALDLYKSSKVKVSGDGTQSRPFLHINDAADAYRLIVEAEKEQVAGQIFNVGADDQNYQLSKLAEEVGNAIGRPYEIEYFGTKDLRSYVASFKKIRETLGFVPKRTVRQGAVEIYKALESGELTDSVKTNTLGWYKHLIAAQNLANTVVLRDTVL